MLCSRKRRQHLHTSYTRRQWLPRLWHREGSFCNIKKIVISSAGQSNLSPLVIPARKQHGFNSQRGNVLIAPFCPIELVTVISTYLLVWGHDHQHSGGAVQSGHPDPAGHEVQPDLHNAGTRQCRGHQRISGHCVSHKLQTNPFPLLTLGFFILSCSTNNTNLCVFFCVLAHHTDVYAFHH